MAAAATSIDTHARSYGRFDLGLRIRICFRCAICFHAYREGNQADESGDHAKVAGCVCEALGIPRAEHYRLIHLLLPLFTGFTRFHPNSLGNACYKVSCPYLLIQEWHSDL